MYTQFFTQKLCTLYVYTCLYAHIVYKHIYTSLSLDKWGRMEIFEPSKILKVGVNGNVWALKFISKHKYVHTHDYTHFNAVEK
jgi:hypothetical protein